jgi:hypothetical protein
MLNGMLASTESVMQKEAGIFLLFLRTIYVLKKRSNLGYHIISYTYSSLSISQLHGR